MYRRCGYCFHFCHHKTSHAHAESFSEHWPYCGNRGQQPGYHTHCRGRGRKGLFFCRRETVHILFPLPASETGCTDRATRDRPQALKGCSFTVPRVGQGLRSPGTRHGSERPPGWALAGPPVRARLPLTSLGGEDPACPCAAAALRPDGCLKTGSGAHGPEVADAAARTPGAPGARPACQRRGRPLAAAAAAPFCSSSSLLPAAHTTPTWAAGKPVTDVVSTLSRATPSSQRRRRHCFGRPLCVGLRLRVGLHSNRQLAAD